MIPQHPPGPAVPQDLHGALMQWRALDTANDPGLRTLRSAPDQGPWGHMRARNETGWHILHGPPPGDIPLQWATFGHSNDLDILVISKSPIKPEGPPAVHAPGVFWGSEWLWEPVDRKYSTSYWQDMFFDEGTPGGIPPPEPDLVPQVRSQDAQDPESRWMAAQAEEPHNTTRTSQEEVGWRGVPVQDDDPETTPVFEASSSPEPQAIDEMMATVTNLKLRLILDGPDPDPVTEPEEPVQAPCPDEEALWWTCPRTVPRTQGSTVWDSVDLEESQVDAPRIAYLQDDLQQVLQERKARLLGPGDIGQLMNDILGEPEEGMGPWNEQPWFHLCYLSEPESNPESMAISEEHRRSRSWRAGAMALASGRKWRAGTFDQGPAARKTKKRRRCKGPEDPATKKTRKRRACKSPE